MRQLPTNPSSLTGFKAEIIEEAFELPLYNPETETGYVNGMIKLESGGFMVPESLEIVFGSIISKEASNLGVRANVMNVTLSGKTFQASDEEKLKARQDGRAINPTVLVRNEKTQEPVIGRANYRCVFTSTGARMDEKMIRVNQAPWPSSNIAKEEIIDEKTGEKKSVEGRPRIFAVGKDNFTTPEKFAENLIVMLLEEPEFAEQVRQYAAETKSASEKNGESTATQGQKMGNFKIDKSTVQTGANETVIGED